MSLLDKIQKGMSAAPQKPQGTGTQTESIRSLLQAKTGKASSPSSGPSQSNIKERMATQAADIQGKQQQQTGALQAGFLGEQAADIQQRGDIQAQQSEQQSRFLDQGFKEQLDGIINSFERGQKQLGAQRDISDIEQVGIAARLQNDEYIQNLKNEASKNRINNAKDFKLELQKQVLADSESILKDDLAFKTITQATDREFQRELSDLDINYALDMADKLTKQQAAQQVAEGVGGLVSAGTQAYGAFKTKKD